MKPRKISITYSSIINNAVDTILKYQQQKRVICACWAIHWQRVDVYKKYGISEGDNGQVHCEFLKVSDDFKKLFYEGSDQTSAFFMGSPIDSKTHDHRIIALLLMKQIYKNKRIYINVPVRYGSSE